MHDYKEKYAMNASPLDMTSEKYISSYKVINIFLGRFRKGKWFDLNWML